MTDDTRAIKFSIIFHDFLEYLVQLGYSDSVNDLIEGVFQRAFLDEFVDYLAKRKESGIPLIEHIKNELIE